MFIHKMYGAPEIFTPFPQACFARPHQGTLEAEKVDVQYTGPKACQTPVKSRRM